MCRPNYSQWVISERKTKQEPLIVTIRGEGSHCKIAERRDLDNYRIIREVAKRVEPAA